MRNLGSSIVFVSVACLLSCSSTSESETPLRAYVGAVEGSTVRVGVATEGGRAEIFFCGDRSNAATHTQWFNVTAAPGASFQTKVGAWTVDGRYDAGSAAGTVDRGDGVKLAWSAKVQPTDSVNGLYEGIDEGGRAGVIIADVPQGVFISGPRDEFSQITPLFPVVKTSQGIAVKFTVGNVERRLNLLPARP
jgi:hypothetical protein